MGRTVWLRHSTHKSLVKMCVSLLQEATEPFPLFLVCWALRESAKAKVIFYRMCRNSISNRSKHQIATDREWLSDYLFQGMHCLPGRLLGFWPVCSPSHLIFLSLGRLDWGWLDVILFCCSESCKILSRKGDREYAIYGAKEMALWITGLLHKCENQPCSDPKYPGKRHA